MEVYITIFSRPRNGALCSLCLCTHLPIHPFVHLPIFPVNISKHPLGIGLWDEC